MSAACHVAEAAKDRRNNPTLAWTFATVIGPVRLAGRRRRPVHAYAGSLINERFYLVMNDELGEMALDRGIMRNDISATRTISDSRASAKFQNDRTRNSRTRLLRFTPKRQARLGGSLGRSRTPARGFGVIPRAAIPPTDAPGSRGALLLSRVQRRT